MRLGVFVNRLRLPRPAFTPYMAKATRKIKMSSGNKFLDDMSQLMTNAMGVAQGFDAVRAMALKAREENVELAARLAALEAKRKA
jgi:BMFP domain-containing protein YqiC